MNLEGGTRRKRLGRRVSLPQRKKMVWGGGKTRKNWHERGVEKYLGREDELEIPTMPSKRHQERGEES